VRVSLVVCWDLGFPEVAREAAMDGADLILAPAAWREPWGPQYDLSCAARALDSGVFVASANQLGDYGEALFATPGHVYGPDGLRISRSTGSGNTCDLDPTAPGRWRGLYGNTFTDDFEAAIVDEEPLEACS
jgi:predicted amidohydrolase